VLDGLIYVIGGKGGSGVIVSDVHRFDPVANSWSVRAPMSETRSGFGAFVLGGSIGAVGGWDGSDALISMERYCVASDSWSSVSDLSIERDALGAYVMRLEVEYFDSLIAKAKQARRW
jgi:hypothetical protein